MSDKIFMFFDTNFIYGKKPQKSFFESLKEKSVDPYISENVVIELKGQNVRRIKLDYDALYKATQRDMCKLYFDINLDIDLEKCYLESDKRMDKYISDLFGDNIIKKESNSKMMQILIERNRFKIPPFANQNSDKGWVDTLIWLSFVNFCSGNKDYKKYIFVTEDKGFLDNFTELKKEFEEKCGSLELEIKNYSSCDEILKSFGIEQNNSDVKEKKPAFIAEQSEMIKIDEQYIEKVQIIIQNIFTTLVRNNFDEWIEKNCKLKRQLSLQEAEEFCNIIIKNRNNYIFFPTIDLNDFFSELKVECETMYLVENKYINDFADEWTNINNNRMELKMPFLQFVLSKINDMYVYDSDDDLPF